MRDFGSPVTHFGADGLGALRAALDRRGVVRVLVLSGPSRRFVPEVAEALAGLELEVFDGARAHVPKPVVDEARACAERFRPEAIVSVGGGAATGLGKMLRLDGPELRFSAALPTTYAGSEMTSIFGTTDGQTKRTGRDHRARPDAVFYLPRFSAGLDLAQKVRSLLNALAHPVSALTTDKLEGEARREALGAVRQLVRAALQLAETPDDEATALDALRGAARAGRLLDRAPLGAHHARAHFAGGRFDVEHAGLHALLLPHTVGEIADSQPALLRELERAAEIPDLPGQLFDLLRRVGAPTALRDLGVERAALLEALEANPELPPALFRAAWLGRRPSSRGRREDWGFAEPVALAGAELSEARTVAICLHGRNSTAESILGRFFEVATHDPSLAAVAPQAPLGAWYAHSYRDSPATISGSAGGPRIGAPLEEALETIGRVIAGVQTRSPGARLVLFGFSQGGCLAAEAAARSPQSTFAAVVAIAAARVGPSAEYDEPVARFPRTPMLFGVAEEDAWVDPPDVNATARYFEASGAAAETIIEPGGSHHISPRQQIRAREIILGRPSPVLRGFGAHETEALPGALPKRGNTPRLAPYALYSEQVNQTGFVATRAENRRSWTYRVRPAAQHGRFARLEGSKLSPDFEPGSLDPNLSGYAPLPLPEAPTDFVDGLATFGGAGRPELRRGFAIHLYSANRSMHERAFYDADGELLLVPEAGRLVLLTEMGVLRVGPGKIAIVPRGVRFSVLLEDEAARGYVAEVYGRTFELPDRGPVGANGLTEERHFEAPAAWYEHRLAPGFEIVSKHGGHLWSARQDFSPFDVVAWHGNLAPRAYDLMDFSPVGNTRFDHPDPSIYTVLSAPLDERGAHALDFVFFPPRWDVTEDTFRPPFFHRNATTEVNGIIRDPSGDQFPFYAGGWFVTPPMTPHGVRRAASQRMFRSEVDPEPSRGSERSMWFQFESALPLALTRWGRELPQKLEGWPEMWGSYPTHFDPWG